MEQHDSLEKAWVRPVQAGDLADLLRLAASAGVGLTTLPNNADVLEHRIARSQAAFSATPTAPKSENYLLVLEVEGRVVACSAIEAAVGTEQAFYNYHVGRSVFASRELGVYRSIPTLYLSNDLTGATELGSLFVEPAWRHTGAGQLMSLCRFLLIAAHRRRFGTKVIAELRGVADSDGTSPFWESLGRAFFAMDFSRADTLSLADTRSFIAELMPKHPVYTVLLSASAQAAIGQVHELTRGARRILEREGFRYRDYVDIFDAGPALEAETENIVSIRKLRRAAVCAGAPGPDAVWAIVANLRCAGFRAIRARLRRDQGKVVMAATDLTRLGLAVGDCVQYRQVTR